MRHLFLFFFLSLAVAVCGQESIVSAETQSLDELYHQFDLPFQRINIKATEAQRVTCQDGTELNIEANSFVYRGTKTDVKTEITLLVREYYTMSSMLFANQSTTGDGKLLETGGMIYLAAIANGRQCELKKEKNIKVSFVDKDSVSNNPMQLFLGNRDGANNINWIEAKPYVGVKEGTFAPNAQTTSAQYAGGDYALRDSLLAKIVFNRSDIPDSIVGRDFFVFLYVNPVGMIKNIATRELKKQAPQFALSLETEMRKGEYQFTPAYYKKDFMPTKGLAIVPIRVHISKEKELDFLPLLSQSYPVESKGKMKLQQQEDELEKDCIALLATKDYSYDTPRMGWLAFGRYLNDTREKIFYEIELNDRGEISGKLIFKKNKTIVDGRLTKGVFKTHFPVELPLGEPATIILLKNEEGQINLSTKPVEVNANGESGFKFQTISTSSLRSEMEKLLD